MARGHIYIDRGGDREGKTRFPATGGAVSPHADVIETFPDDTLASVTERAYGANTPRLRQKINRANSNLEGTVNAPR